MSAPAESLPSEGPRVGLVRRAIALPWALGATWHRRLYATGWLRSERLP